MTKTKRPLTSTLDKNVVYPPGTEIALVEQLDKHTWIGEVRVPAEDLVGGFRFDTITVKKEDLDQ